jgi:hypothetical protein
VLGAASNFCNVWHFLDLVPEGAGGWQPQYSSWSLAKSGRATHLSEQGDVEPQGSVAWTATING